MINIKRMLPMLEENEINELADKLFEQPETYNNLKIEDIIPFLEENKIDDLTMKLFNQGKDIKKYIFFTSENFKKKLFLEASLRDDYNYQNSVNCLDDEDIKQFYYRILKSNLKNKFAIIKSIVVLLDEDFLSKEFKNLSELGFAYNDLLPFVTEEYLHVLCEDYLNGDNSVDIDALYPYLGKTDIKALFQKALNEKNNC